MLRPTLLLALLAAFAIGCVDGTTPDCSKINCGPATLDGAYVDDGSTDAAADAPTDTSVTDAPTDAPKVDANVSDAKTD